MKRLRIDKHHYGFCIPFTRNIFFDMDINEWCFLPSIEFHRRPGLANIFVVAFLCFSLNIYRWWRRDWIDCKFNKHDNNDKKDRDGGKKDEQTNYSI